MLTLVDWFRRSSLVAQIGSGADPLAETSLVRLSQELGALPHRRRIADALEAAVAAAAAPPVSRRAACELNRHELLVARDELERLAARLRDPAPVCSRGVALAEQLLTDPAGPLYFRDATASAWRLARNAREALDS